MPIYGGEYRYMKNYDSRTYCINDFIEWNERKQLSLSPKFQRRSVWSPQAKSYLIDTIVRGKPLPKVFIRQITNPVTRITLREVVDGQQRLRTILDYINNGFKISSVHNEEFGGLNFSELPDELKTDILNYEIAADLLLDLEDGDILDIFARLNTYAVSLNKQELLNAKYFGYFKQLVYKLGFEYTKFWVDNGIYSNNKIMRMAESELISDLLTAMLEGIQSRKFNEKLYAKYDESFSLRQDTERQFKHTMDLIGDLLGENLKDMNFSRPPVFYGLFMSLYHMNYGINNFDANRQVINPSDHAKVRSALSDIDSVLSLKIIPDRYQDFVNSITKATTDAARRKESCTFISEYIYNYLSGNIER